MSKAVRSLANPRHTPSGCPSRKRSSPSAIRPQAVRRVPDHTADGMGEIIQRLLDDEKRISVAYDRRAGLATACRGA